MTCTECGRWIPSDPETGYDADLHCSAACEQIADERRAEDAEGETCPCCGDVGCQMAPYCGLTLGDVV
jgi:predicted amino acid dehydrogenase